MTTPMTAETLLPCKKGRPITHGHTVNVAYSPTYHSWQEMLTRCRYPKRDRENKHCNRGITVCEHWKIFENFLNDMGERPAGTSIDRIDNNGNYETGNCRWATATQQARNNRHTRLTFETALDIAKRMVAGEKA